MDNFKTVQDRIQAALVAATKTSNRIAAEDLNFQRSSNPSIGEDLDETSGRLLGLATKLMKSATQGTEANPPKLEDADDVDVHWSRAVDVFDTLLEKADTCLDEYTGLIKRKSAPTEETGSAPKKSKIGGKLDPSMRRANIVKPQNAFETKTNHLDSSSWTPILTKKPHAKLPLAKSLQIFTDEQGQQQYKHPYEHEITNLEYPATTRESREPIQYQPTETTAATFIDTYEGVLEMLKELKEAKEIAIDTEHHDFRTYSGLLSLMQISTREKDWIVDTLQPWRHKLEILNQVFADPSIVKVLHGAYMDIIWLQRDCGLYVVGLFDTFHAASVLGYPTKSLAYLLKRFVNFDADKKYQLADWRIRPIPEEMFYYARSDTHYLLYIYDQIRNQLVQESKKETAEKDRISRVLNESKNVSLRRYEKPVYDKEAGQGPNGWYNMLIKQSSGSLTREQFSVFRALHQWRDDVARREDESPLFIMSNAAIFEVARRLPPDPKALHSLLDFNTSRIAKQTVSDMWKTVQQARAKGNQGPSVAEFLRQTSVQGQGIGAVAKRVIPRLSAKEETSLEAKDVIATTSQFWGQVPVSSRWDPDTPVNAVAARMEFSLPWATFVENASLLESKPSAPAAQIDPVTPVEEKVPLSLPQDENEDEDEEFTVKAGMKRKAPEPNSEVSEEEGQAPMESKPNGIEANDDEISVGSSSDEGVLKEEPKKTAKAKRQAARRAAKKAAKAAKKAAREGGGETPESKSFDYTKAKSVLHGARNNGEDGARGKVKTFNPYSSLSVEGPRPARKMHGEKAGKSATFQKM